MSVLFALRKDQVRQIMRDTLRGIRKKLNGNRHRIMGFIWIGLTPPAILWWKESILFVILCSLYANIESAFAADEAQRTREEQE